MKTTAIMTAVLALFSGSTPSQTTDGASVEERIWQHRNLGKAFYENNATLARAVEQFRMALELAPASARERLNYGLALLRNGRTDEAIVELERVQREAPAVPHTWFNLGIQRKRAQDYPEAIRQLRGLLELDPGEAKSHYNLGVLYRLTDRDDLAIEHFKAAARLDPHLAAPHFQLRHMFRRQGKTEQARLAHTEFRRLKEAQKDAAIAEDLEWSIYAEILDEVDPIDRGQDLEVQPRLPQVPLPERLDPSADGLLLIDSRGDGGVDLLAWSSSRALLFEGAERLVSESGLEGLGTIAGLAAGDFDNDGLPDLCVLTAQSAVLLRNVGGRFATHSTALPRGRYNHAVWLDFDHDYDLDLFLFGERSSLLRNEGDSGFRDVSQRFPFRTGKVVAAVAFDSTKDWDGQDLVVSFENRQGILYRDLLGGTYQAVPVAGIAPRVGRLLGADLDNDGWTDLVASSPSEVSLFLNRRGRLQAQPFPNLRLEAAGTGLSPAIALVDLESRGLRDLIVQGRRYRNLGRGQFGPGRPLDPSPAVDWAVADFDGDGRDDLAVLARDGSLNRLDNRSAAGNWIGVGLKGVRNLSLAPGAEVEVKAGSLYQKRVYQGLPLRFGLGKRSKVETVRITWPNGLIQNETLQPPNQSRLYTEKQRLSGSCPMIFTWNGERFEFITDILGVAPLGAGSGDGQYFVADHDEYVSIPSRALAVRDGSYQIRITEELREVAYLDEIRLMALDHPASVQVLTNEKFKAPPFPQFRVFTIDRRHHPVEARDDRGRDILESISRKDRSYPRFERDLNGLAEMHAIELDFGKVPADSRLLVLNGWLDWADGSTFIQASQGDSGGLTAPYLQVRDREGRWRTVIEDMGIPAGKPKTIVVDLSGKFLSESRRIRIVTNLCLYWDQIFMARDAKVEVRPFKVPLQRAELHFRGFSTPKIHPERLQPEAFDYSSWLPSAMWNQTPGLYTRFGDVVELLQQVDDRMVVMGSGDELKLSFHAAALPPLRPGWKRSFLLFADGWAKDGDLNTAFSRSVEPLPFHDMSAYPYPPDESFPDTKMHSDYRRRYNTRRALRLLQPLAGPGFRPGPRDVRMKDDSGEQR